jgi:hypothetical protein
LFFFFFREPIVRQPGLCTIEPLWTSTARRLSGDVQRGRARTLWHVYGRLQSEMSRRLEAAPSAQRTQDQA